MVQSKEYKDGQQSHYRTQVDHVTRQSCSYFSIRVFLKESTLVSTSAHGEIREDIIEVSGYANVVPHGAEL
jgi:hypothetical protein